MSDRYNLPSVTVGSAAFIVNTDAMVSANTVVYAWGGGMTAASDLSPSVTYAASSSANTEIGAAVIPYNNYYVAASQTTTDLMAYYQNVLWDQCLRFNNHISEILHSPEVEEDPNHVIADIASKLDLLGETGYCAAAAEANSMRRGSRAYETLLLAIAASSDVYTETLRVNLLRSLALSANVKGNRAAVRALGQMQTSEAKEALRDASKGSKNLEASRLACAYLSS